MIYGSLFLGYRTYYQSIGITPEDAGVGNAFILVRGVGFLLIACLIAAAIMLNAWLLAGLASESSTWGDASLASCIGVLSLVVGFYMSELAPSWPPWIGVIGCMTVLLAIGLPATELVPIKLFDSKFGVAVITAVLVAVVVPTLAINQRAQSLAQTALSGAPVSPYTIFAVPILDVSADPVAATWICASAQRPPIFGNQGAIDGMQLAETSTAYVLRVQESGPTTVIVTLPKSCVSSTRRIG